MSPKESAAGASEKYTMRVPNEKAVPNVRIEAEFPAAVVVTEFEAKPGWKIEPKKDAAGRLNKFLGDDCSYGMATFIVLSLSRPGRL